MQAAAASTATPVFFTGEMVFPWLFDDIAGLRPFKQVAEVIAEADAWPALYDSAKLRQNSLPVASACYCEVCTGLCEQTTCLLHDSQFFRSPSLTTCSRRCIKDHSWACMQCQKVLGCLSVLTLQSTAGEIARNTSWRQYSHLVSMPLPSVMFKSKASCLYCTPKHDSCLSTFRIPRALHNMECKRGMSRLSCHGCKGIRFSLEILGSCTGDRLNCTSGDSIGPNDCTTLLCLPYIVDHRN